MIKDYYEQLYSHAAEINPALEIYDRLRVKTIENLIEDKNSKVLIVGCGYKNDIQMLRKLPNAIAFDLAFNAVSSIEGDLNLLNADAVNLPFRSGIFDYIICSEVIEHIPDAIAVIREFNRVNQPNGKIIISTPNWNSLFGLVRFFGEKILKRQLSSDNQPYDDWKSLRKLRELIAPVYKIEKVRGVWYHFPWHFRGRGLPRWATRILYFLTLPFDTLFSAIFPSLGHLIIIRASKR